MEVGNIYHWSHVKWLNTCLKYVIKPCILSYISYDVIEKMQNTDLFYNLLFSFDMYFKMVC